MAGKNDIILQSQYDRAIAARKDLEEQLNTKQRQWQEQEAAYKKVDFFVRKLCEEILVRDPSEIVLGQLYSWDSLPTLELVHKAISGFRSYNEKRTDLMRKLMDIAEDRRIENESLQDQIQMLKVYAPKRESVTVSTITDTETEEKSELPENESGVEDTAPSLQQNDALPVVEMIIEEDRDITEKDLQDAQEVIAMAESMQPIKKEIPVHPARKILQAKERIQREQRQAYIVNLKDYQDKMTDLMWRLMEIVGKEGISSYIKIEPRLMERMPSFTTRSKIRMSVQSLYSMGLLDQEQISDPLRSKYYAYRLTEIGHRLYKDHFGEPPVLSELDRIVSQHDNANHGYGIQALKELLEESKCFDSVCSDAKKNTILLEHGGRYIPDIVARKDKECHYFEYECGTHTQQDFSAKCNKMCRVSSILNFVVPNREILHRRILSQVKEWIKQKGGRKALHGKIVRLATAVSLKGSNPIDNNSWQVIFTMESDEPVMNS